MSNFRFMIERFEGEEVNWESDTGHHQLTTISTFIQQFSFRHILSCGRPESLRKVRSERKIKGENTGR